MDRYDFGLDEPENDLPSFEEFLALRGGAGPSQIPGDINNDSDDAPPNDGHFSDMEDVIMNDVGPSERFDEDSEEAVPGLAPCPGDAGGLASDPQHPSWIDGFGGGLRGGASPPRNNSDEEGGEEQSETPQLPPNVNGPDANANNATPPPPASLPPLASMESVLATLQQNSRHPSSVRRRRVTPSTNKENFDPSQYREYMIETAKNLEQDDLRVAAYHKAQSVHEPHAAKPEPPRYGKSVENQLVTGPTMPSVFANSSSLSEIRQILARNGELERLVLGRTTYCGMCDKSIPFTTKEQQDAHFAGHIDGLHSCGFCGISFNTATQAERKSHLASHADVRYTKQAADTSQQPDTTAVSPRPTPVNSGSRKLTQTPVVEGDIILYCQNCSVDLARFTTSAQLIEHTRACPRRNLPPSEPAYCKFCGIEITTLGNADDITNHRNLCKGSAAGRDRQRELWAIAATSTNDDRGLTYWKLSALSGVPDLHYKPRYPAPKPYECRYSGCPANLLQEAKDGTLDAHHKRHISNGDRLKNICQADGCGEDLSVYETQGKERLQRHLTRHLIKECTFPGCKFTFRNEDISPSTHEIEVEAKRRWIHHAQTHLNEDEDDSDDGHGVPDSDPPSDNDNHGGRRGTAGHTQQGTSANTNVGPRSTGTITRQTQGNNPAAIPQVPRAPAPRRPAPSTNIPTMSRGVQSLKGRFGPGPPLYFAFIPKEWSEAISLLTKKAYKGSSKKQNWAFICPVCYLGIRGHALPVRFYLSVYSALSLCLLYRIEFY